MKFTVLSAVKFHGRIYTDGETIDTDAQGAAALPAHCVAPQGKGKRPPLGLLGIDLAADAPEVVKGKCGGNSRNAG